MRSSDPNTCSRMNKEKRLNKSVVSLMAYANQRAGAGHLSCVGWVKSIEKDAEGGSFRTSRNSGKRWGAPAHDLCVLLGTGF